MNITLEPVNFKISAELDERVREMFNKLTKFNDQIVGIDLYMKSLPETDLDEKLVEAKIFLPGNDIFVVGKGETFISASQDCYDTAKRQLSKAKEQIKDRHQVRPDKE